MIDPDEIRRRLLTLTPTERKVQVLSVWGYEIKQTAAILGITQSTVQLHRSRILSKLRARNLPHAATMIARAQSPEEWEADRLQAFELFRSLGPSQRGNHNP